MIPVAIPPLDDHPLIDAISVPMTPASRADATTKVEPNMRTHPTPRRFGVAGTSRATGSAGAILVLLAVLLAAAVTACGGSGSNGANDGEAGGSSGEDGSTATVDVDGRIVALGEERFLADLLALGVRPVASTANVVVDGGFVGLDDFDTEGIEPLPGSEPNVERLALLEPDVIVTNEFVDEYLGHDTLTRMADVVVIPDGDAESQVLALGDAFGRRAEAEALIAGLDDAIAEGREALADVPEEDRVVSVATIYSGPTLAVWADGPVDVPATLLALGYALRPDAEAVAGVPGGPTDGRAYISEEQIGLLDAPTLVLMQTKYVDGEDEAIAEMEENPLWTRLPAVQSGNVVTVDRLGYPGIAGRTKLVSVLVEALGG